MQCIQIQGYSVLLSYLYSGGVSTGLWYGEGIFILVTAQAFLKNGSVQTVSETPCQQVPSQKQIRHPRTVQLEQKDELQMRCSFGVRGALSDPGGPPSPQDYIYFQNHAVSFQAILSKTGSASPPPLGSKLCSAPKILDPPLGCVDQAQYTKIKRRHWDMEGLVQCKRHAGTTGRKFLQVGGSRLIRTKIENPNSHEIQSLNEITCRSPCVCLLNFIHRIHRIFTWYYFFELGGMYNMVRNIMGSCNVWKSLLSGVGRTDT